MPKLNTTTSGIITATLTADSSPTLELQQNGVTIRTLGESQLVLGTAQSTATGATAYDFTGIPSWAKRITVMFNGVSVNGGTPNYLIQIGSGSVTTSGYANRVTYFQGSTISGSNGTAGFIAAQFGAGNTLSGALTLTLLGSNTWIATGYFADSGTNATSTGGNSPALGGALDRVRITTTNGTDTFDAGTVNIMWE